MKVGIKEEFSGEGPFDLDSEGSIGVYHLEKRERGFYVEGTICGRPRGVMTVGHRESFPGVRRN